MRLMTNRDRSLDTLLEPFSNRMCVIESQQACTRFIDAVTLVADFWAEVEAVMKERSESDD
jgi:hypothetical protein